MQLYEYTFNSNRFRIHQPHEEDDHNIDGPIIKFSYDISPMQVWGLGFGA